MTLPRKKTKSNKNPMHPADIKAALEKVGSSPISIARTLKVAPTSVANVIHSRAKSKRIALEISKVTYLSLEMLFADAYDYDARELAKKMEIGTYHG